jgi:hypothetical protein
MPTGKTAGWEYRVFVDGTALRARRFSFKPAVPELDVTDSESPSNAALDFVYAETLYGVGKVTWSIEQATFDPDDNPFASPLSLLVGTYHDFEIEPRDSAERHTFKGLILGNTHDGEVTGLQPITIEGVSDGVFTSAGEVV